MIADLQCKQNLFDKLQHTYCQNNFCENCNFIIVFDVLNYQTCTQRYRVSNLSHKTIYEQIASITVVVHVNHTKAD